MSSGVITVTIHNEAKYPLRNLVIAHWQDTTDATVNVTHQFNGITRGQKLEYLQSYVSGHDHWVVTWENRYDLAVYYLVHQDNFLADVVPEIADATRDLIDDALKEALENPEILAAIDSATVSDGAGNDRPSAALLLANDILNKHRSPAFLSHRIQTKKSTMDITLNCNRKTALFDPDSETFHTSCHVVGCK
jgi:hypothetical protein